ncbi:MAG: hypothetical protein K9G40_00205 [Crocinitomicaceae bacterium]|nr:hypothetical protein [Crocinitomicaceae bacterium]MCF8434366.1 hypothetical protein [Crocinitomicaceae bacterium]
MKNILYLTTLLVISAIFTSCKEIIAEDITNRTPELIVPTISDTVMSNPVQFKWEAMDGATKYHLQVVSPSFSTISDYVIDTIIYTTNFSFPLDSNEFELKLTALNGGYTSKTLGPIHFWVGISPSSSTGTITLLSPSEDAYINESFDGTFTWQGFMSASSYEYSLRKGSSFATGSIQHTQNGITASSYVIPNTVELTEGLYYWGVKGYTQFGETYFKTSTFQVDLTDPTTPSLLYPTSMDFPSSGLINFTWNNGTDVGVIQSPIQSIIEVSVDPGFSSILKTDTLIGSSQGYTLSPGTYYWRVINMDLAGNSSAYSIVHQFFAN